MHDLFDQTADNHFQIKTQQAEISKVNGLRYVPGFLSLEEQVELVRVINSQPWLTDIKRRVQHYGYKYDYKQRNIDHSMYLGELPQWAKTLAVKLYQDKLIKSVPDQVIVNEYLPGQGIAHHIDCAPCFGDTIISISLCSKSIMEFIHSASKEKVSVLLEPGSLVIISNEARHLWKHGIPARKVDLFKGEKINRKLRISITFRKVILKDSNKLALKMHSLD